MLICNPRAVLAAAGDATALPVLATMAFGVVLTFVGHVAKNRLVVGVGIAALFLATALMIVVGLAAYNDTPPDPKCVDTPGSFRAC